MINWTYFPLVKKPTDISYDIIEIFKKYEDQIDSTKKIKQESNEVLSVVRKSLSEIDFKVETGKKKNQKITIPVLYGKNGKIIKSFEADAYNELENYVIEIEAGRAVSNYQFLKDLFQACIMQDVKYLCIAVRNQYRTSNDYLKVFDFFDTLYKSDRIDLPLKGILLVGY